MHLIEYILKSIEHKIVLTNVLKVKVDRVVVQRKVDEGDRGSFRIP